MSKKIKILVFFLCIQVFFLPILTSNSIKSESVIVPYEDILNEPTTVIDPNKPMVALTFDDGPTRKYTNMILDCLKENKAHATFFILGSRVKNADDILERMVLEGNEIGNHTYSHKQLTTLDAPTIKEEIKKTQEEIYRVTRNYPQTIRPPFGSVNETVLNEAGQLRVVKWTIDSEDWRSKNTKAIVNQVMKDVQDKSIILLHDLYITSAEAACILIPQLIEEGYQLVTISELYSFE